MIKNYNDFVETLLKTGFTLAGNNDEGVFSLSTRYHQNVVWHTADSNTDPWEWRMRVLDERDDIAYAKLFFKKNGYITKQWYPYFLATRRHNKTLEQAYNDGNIGNLEKRIYQIIEREGALPTHLIKQYLELDKTQKSAFDRAITSLQMGLYITVSGRRQKTSQIGENYGWSSTVFCTTEDYFGEAVFDQATKFGADQAYRAIGNQILTLNPNANSKKIKKFILG